MVARRLWFVAAFVVGAACSSADGDEDKNGGIAENTPPVARSQHVETKAGEAVEIVLSGSDADGDTLSFSVMNAPENGKLEGEAPKLVYAPDEDFVGDDAFSFVANDGQENSEPAVVSISVKQADVERENNRPVADSQTRKTRQGEDVSIVLTGSDADGDSLSFTVVTEPEHGELEGEAPNLVYVPSEAFVGDDAFDFVVNDGEEDSEPATVSIQVLAEDEEVDNTPPVANPQSLKTDQDTALSITLGGSDADGDGLSFWILDEPENGELSGLPPQVIYTPDTGFVGSDHFTFAANDGLVDSTPATITIQVLAEDEEVENTPPVANPQTVHALQSQSLEITLTGTDADGDALEFRVVDEPEHGELSGDGGLREYLPSPDFYGQDQFTFVVNDGTDDSEPATVAILVNARPLAEPLEFGTNQDTSIHITPQGSDPGGEVLTFSILAKPKHGTLVEEPEGWRYSPEPDFYGQDEFAYVANDGKQDSDPATVLIHVNARPTVSSQNVSVIEDELLNILVDAEDPDDDDLELRVVSAPNYGEVQTAPSGFTYRANVGFYGTDFFEFVASDGRIDSAPATVIIKVKGRPLVDDLEVEVATGRQVSISPSGISQGGGSLTFEVTDWPEGELDVSEPVWVYSPKPDFTGVDHFFFVARDQLGTESLQAKVSITVHPHAFQLGGVATGIQQGAFAELRLNDDETILASNGTFEFETVFYEEYDYRVELIRNPEGHLCDLDNAEGMAAQDVLDVSLHCRSWKEPENFIHSLNRSAEPQITYNSSGDGILVWSHGLDNTAPESDRPSDILASLYQASNGIWTDPIQLNSRVQDTAVRMPRVLLDDDGEAWVFWKQSDEKPEDEDEGRSYSLRVSHLAGEGSNWSNPIVVREPVGEILTYEAAFSAKLGKGSVMLLTYEREQSHGEDNSRVVWLASGGSPDKWKAGLLDAFPTHPGIVGLISSKGIILQMASSPSGHVAAIWAAEKGFDHSRFTTKGWSDPYNEPTFDHGAIAVTGKGDVLVTGNRWANPSSENGIYVRWFRADAEKMDAGEWEPVLTRIASPLNVSTPTFYQPYLVIDSDHSALVAWRTMRSTTNGQEHEYRAARYTLSSGWFPDENIGSPSSLHSPRSFVGDSKGNAFLIGAPGLSSTAWQYSHTTNSWDMVPLDTGVGQDYTFGIQPSGDATIVYRGIDRANRLRIVHFD